MYSDSYPNRPSRWRHPVSLLSFLAVATFASAAAQADNIVRISSINGDYEAAHAESISVKPGDVVQLSADVFADQGDGSYAPQNKFAENFVWYANDRQDDACDASQGANCLGATNFEVNDYGVSFYVPYDFT